MHFLIVRLYKEYEYAIEDYSSIRGNICLLRYKDFAPMMDESKEKYLEIKDSYLKIMEQLNKSFEMFAAAMCSLEQSKANESHIAILMSCSEDIIRIRNIGAEFLDDFDRRVFSNCGTRNQNQEPTQVYLSDVIDDINNVLWIFYILL